MAQDFETVLGKVLGEMKSHDPSRQAAASAAVAVLLNQAPEGNVFSSTVIPAVLPLLTSDDLLVQVHQCLQSVHERSPDISVYAPFAAEKRLCGFDSYCGAGSNQS